MLKQIDEKQSIVIEEVENIKVKNDAEIQIEKGYGKLVHKDKEKRPELYKSMLEINYVYFYTKTGKTIDCHIAFKTRQEAQDYAKKIVNTNYDYKDYLEEGKKI